MLGNYFTTNDKNPKNEKNREKIGEGPDKVKERERERERHPESSSRMAKKEMKMKRARWLARYKKDDERKGLIPRNVI